MKVFVKKETNIIDVPEEYAASLREITRDGGYFRYEIMYRVDPRKAAAGKAITVHIQASRKPQVRKPTNLLTGYNPDKLILNLLQKSSITKDQGRSQKGDVFFTYLSDISARIPNNKTSMLSVNPNISRSVSDLIMNMGKNMKLKSVSELSSQNTIMPVLENNIAATLFPPAPRNAVAARSTSMSLALKSIDPAQISGMRTNTIQSARKVAGGVVSKPGSDMLKFNLSDSQKVSLLGDLVNNNNPNNHLQLQRSDFLNVLVNQPQTTIDVSETLDIPVGLLQMDEFYLILTLVDNKGIELQTINITVPHTRNVAALQIPVLPPKMEILQTGLPGKNVINVKQTDPNATGVSIYRKELRTGTAIMDAAFSFVGSVDCTVSQDFQRIEDIVNNSNPIIYRAIPYNSNGTLSAEFTSVGAKPAKFPSKKVNRRRNFTSLSGDIVSGGISIEIRDVPPGVSIVRLYRKDMTIHERTRTLVTTPSLITDEETLSPIFVTDNDVKTNRIYEYQVELLYPDGDIETGSSNLVIEYNPISANVVDTSVSKPVVVQNGVDLDVQFTIESSIMPKNLDAVKSALTAQGLSQFYDGAMADERQNFQNIIAFGVTRTNLTTGEVEDFGVITDRSFSDSKLGPVQGVKPLVSGNEYRYTITTFFRSAETTLSTVEREVITGTNTSYMLKPSRWLHPVTLNAGNLVSVRSLVRNHSKTTFSFGSVGNITSTVVSLADITPSIVEAKAQKLGQRSTLIQWRVQGNIKKIDHFIVILEMVGMRTVVGKCHNISESNYFQFVDALDNGEHGKLTYYIMPVYYDFSRGTEASTNEVLI